jgi:phage-related protein
VVTLANAVTERTIKIKFDGTVKGLAATVLEAKALFRDVDKAQKDFNDGFARGAGNAAKAAASFAGKLANLSTAVNALPAVAGWAASASGALGLLPGAAAVAGAALATVKLGADGIKKAFTGVFDPLKASVSSTFEKALVPAVNNTKKLLPQLEGGFKKIATNISGAGTEFTGMLNKKENVNSLNAILNNSATFVKNIGAALAPVGQAFLAVASVGSNYFTQLTDGAGQAAEKFGAWVQQAKESGKIADWIQGGVEAFKQLFAALGDIAGIVGDVFKGLSGGAEGAISPLAQVLDTIHQFTSSAEGQKALNALGEALRTVGAAVSGVLMAALKAVGPLIAPLGTAFGSLATSVGSMLVPVLNFLAPVLENIANFIGQNMGWITPLIIAIGAWTAAQWLLNIAMDANPIGLIIIAIGLLIAIVATIITYWTPIKDFFIGIFNAVKEAVTVAAQWIWQRLVDAWNFIKGVWSGVTGFFSGIWSGITGGVTTAMNWVRDRFNDALGFIKGAWSGVGNFFSGIWSSIGNGLKSALNGAIRLLNGAINGINNITGAVGIPGIPNIPYLAKGGTAQGGKPHIVGENGPELFVPGRTGRVVSNDSAFGGGATQITIPIDISDDLRLVVTAEIDRNNRATVQKVRQGRGNHR